MLTGLGAMAALLVAAPSAGAVNQGDESKVHTADNSAVSCAAPVPAEKVEGDLGPTVSVSSEHPIDYVTLKSGKDASVVSATFDLFSGEITLSKDVSNYVVWVCPPDGGGTGDV